MKLYLDLTLAESAARGMITGPGYNPPSIVANHIDGPLLYFSDGQLHWLTLWERALFAFGLTDATRLQKKLRPRLSAEIERIEWACT